MRRLIIISLVIIGMYGGKAYALGECGLSCCIAGAAGSGVTLAETLGLSLVYENTYMKSIRSGTERISPDAAIDRAWTPGTSYKVPTRMTMQKATLVTALPVNERLTVLAYVPYVVNDMEMRNKNGAGMVMNMKMDTVSGLGDAALLGLYTLYTDAPIRPGQRLTVGFGVKAPTGSTDARGSSGALVHAMMQTGSGSWDAMFFADYMRAFYPLVLKANLFYQLTTEGYNGYEFGDQFTYDLSARYQVTNYVNIGADLGGVHAEKDTDHDGRYSSPLTSMLDNPDNTGLDSIRVAAVVQVKFPGTGGSGELKYQRPIYQDVNGVQQVMDHRVLGTLSWVF